MMQHVWSGFFNGVVINYHLPQPQMLDKRHSIANFTSMLRSITYVTLIALIGLSPKLASAQCEAKFTYEVDELTIELTNTSTGNFTIATYDYGDGSFPGFDEIHTYDEGGTYEVCLTILDPFGGCFEEYCEEISVSDYECETDFEYSFNSTNTFQFTNTTVTPHDDVLWEFGDGNTSKFDNPAYTYNESGSYEVCLITFFEDVPCGEMCKDVEVYTLGVDEPESSDLLVYPNPGNGIVEIVMSGSAAQTYNVDILDIAGRVIQSRQVVLGPTSKTFFVSGEPGHYFLRATNDDGDMLIRQVIVQ